MDDHSAIFAVVEDHERSSGDNIVAFSMSLFLTDEFYREAVTTLPPSLSAQALQRWKKGGAFFLDRKAIACHNVAGDLNLAYLHYGWEKSKNEEVNIQLRQKLVEAYYFFQAGYQVKTLLASFHGLNELEMMRTAMPVVRDYSELAGKAGWNHDTRPFLGGLNKEAAKRLLTQASPVFFFPKPRFGFSLSGQDILERALLGNTDEDTARSLGVSIWAVKKRWQEIYRRVEEMDPAILEAADPREDSQKSRKRYLLNYIRVHLEELRPYGASRRGGKRAHPQKRPLSAKTSRKHY